MRRKNMKSKLTIKYQPLLKEIKFTRESEENHKVEPTKLLDNNYSIGQKGNFVLQNQDESFYTNIENSFDGQDSLSIDLLMPKKDFDYFKNRFLASKKTNMELNFKLIKELPSKEDIDFKLTSIFEKLKSHHNYVASLDFQNSFLNTKKIELSNLLQEVTRLLKNISIDIEDDRKKIDKEIHYIIESLHLLKTEIDSVSKQFKKYVFVVITVKCDNFINSNRIANNLSTSEIAKRLGLAEADFKKYLKKPIETLCRKMVQEKKVESKELTFIMNQFFQKCYETINYKLDSIFDYMIKKLKSDYPQFFSSIDSELDYINYGAKSDVAPEIATFMASKVNLIITHLQSFIGRPDITMSLVTSITSILVKKIESDLIKKKLPAILDEIKEKIYSYCSNEYKNRLNAFCDILCKYSKNTITEFSKKQKKDKLFLENVIKNLNAIDIELSKICLEEIIWGEMTYE